ncbi:MAG TPA: CinA family protein [Candidatus Dormibacteraeota bacterium]
MVEGSSFAPLMAPLGEQLKRRGWKVAVAESCTGGLLGATLTDLEGAADVFAGGIITYDYDAKERLLGIPRALLEARGAVSREVAALMAEAVRDRLEADLGLSVTGVAGPTPEEGKPVGLIYVAAACCGRTEVRELRLGEGRASNRIGAVEHAIELSLVLLDGAEPE